MEKQNIDILVKNWKNRSETSTFIDGNLVDYNTLPDSIKDIFDGFQPIFGLMKVDDNKFKILDEKNISKFTKYLLIFTKAMDMAYEDERINAYFILEKNNEFYTFTYVKDQEPEFLSIDKDDFLIASHLVTISNETFKSYKKILALDSLNDVQKEFKETIEDIVPKTLLGKRALNE